MNPRTLVLAACLPWITFGIGCVTPIQPQALIPPATPAAKSYPGTVEVAVTGNFTAPLITVIDLNTFRIAVREAVRQSQVFNGGMVDAAGDYLLDVNILSAEWPGPGVSMTTALTSQWKVTRKGGAAPLCNEIIRTSHTTPLMDAFNGGTRARHSIEAAGRTMIADGLNLVGKHAP